jgi:hypothetical protein
MSLLLAHSRKLAEAPRQVRSWGLTGSQGSVAGGAFSSVHDPSRTKLPGIHTSWNLLGQGVSLHSPRRRLAVTAQMQKAMTHPSVAPESHGEHAGADVPTAAICDMALGTFPNVALLQNLLRTAPPRTLSVGLPIEWGVEPQHPSASY